jgi:glycosyltransferase involved in cell wall biosynthesis
MRVLLFRSLCDTGGVSSSMLLLGERLRARGIECEYWFVQGSNRLADFQAKGGTTLAGLSRLGPRLARGDFDVVHMTSTDPAALMVAEMEGPQRIVVTARGAISDLWGKHNCHAYTAISNGMAEITQPYTDLAVEVVRNSIDTSRYSPPETIDDGSAPILAFVGRTRSPEKDFPRFTRIAAKMKTPGLRVWIADPHEAKLEKFAGKGAAQIEPERWGRVPNGEIPDFYRSVAASGGVVLITSITEGFGNVAPEAAACGARVAATDVMGLREAVVDGVTGMLFPPDASDDEVAARLDAWLARPHDPGSTSDATKREFSPTVMVDAYVAIYERTEQRLAPANGPPPPGTPELRYLIKHLERQRGWRAEFARRAAVDLAHSGYRKRAIGALSEAFRLAPRQFLSKAAARQLLSVGKNMIFGRRR